MEHKIGDVVKIKSIDWYNENKDETGSIDKENTPNFAFEMSEYCGRMAKITRAFPEHRYSLDIDNGRWTWCDDYFEEEAVETSSVEGKEFTNTSDEDEGELSKAANTLLGIGKKQKVSEDMVNHPSHYTWLKDKCGIEVIDITRHLDFDLGNSVKYILRSNHKHDDSMSDKEKAIQDLEKAIFYLKDEIELIKKNN